VIRDGVLLAVELAIGRLSIARLVAKHGRDDQGDLRAKIAVDYPKMQNPSPNIYDQCGVHFPELPALVLGRRSSQAAGGLCLISAKSRSTLRWLIRCPAAVNRRPISVAP
jgi:hypothetical protein